jgi:hypothetical protein
MEDRELKMEDRKWRIEDGKSRMEDEGEDERWATKRENSLVQQAF